MYHKNSTIGCVLISWESQITNNNPYGGRQYSRWWTRL